MSLVPICCHLDVLPRLGVFVTRMDSVGTGGAAGLKDLVATKVGLGRRGGSNEYGLVGHADKKCVLITIHVQEQISTWCQFRSLEWNNESRLWISALGSQPSKTMGVTCIGFRLDLCFSTRDPICGEWSWSRFWAEQEYAKVYTFQSKQRRLRCRACGRS